MLVEGLSDLPFQDGNDKGSCLARPCASHGHQVLPLHHEGDGFALDRSWQLVTLAPDALQDCCAQPQGLCRDEHICL